MRHCFIRDHLKIIINIVVLRYFFKVRRSLTRDSLLKRPNQLFDLVDPSIKP